MNYNPKVSDFLKENKDVTLMGLFWSMYWRFFLVIFGGVFALSLLLEAVS